MRRLAVSADVVTHKASANGIFDQLTVILFTVPFGTIGALVGHFFLG